MFFLAAAVNITTNIVYVFLGSAEEQPFNNPQPHPKRTHEAGKNCFAAGSVPSLGTYLGYNWVFCFHLMHAEDICLCSFIGVTVLINLPLLCGTEIDEQTAPLLGSPEVVYR